MVSAAAAMVAAMLGVLLWVSAPWLISLSALALLGALLIARRWRLLVVAALSAAWATVSALGTLHDQELVPRTARVSGCVVSPVRVDGRRLRFAIRTTTVDDRAASKYVRVSLYDGYQVPRAGECFVWRLKLRPPRGLLNHLGDDAERRAFVLGIDAYATVDTRVAARPAGVRWQTTGLRWRLALARRIRFLGGEQSAWPLFVALTIGERSGFPATWRDVMRDTGTAHLMAISGLHIGLVAGMGFVFGRLLGGALAGLPRSPPAGPMMPWGCALVCATAYSALAGFALPTLRALVMLWVFGLAALARRQIGAADGLALALMLVVALAPRALLTGGLWLSFGAVAALMSLRLQLRERVWLAQWVAFVGLLPAVAMFMGAVAWVSPLANAVSVPVYACLVVPLTLLAAGLSSVSSVLAAKLYAMLSQLLAHQRGWLEGVAALPSAVVHVPDWSVWHVAIASLAVVVLLLRLGRLRVRLVALAACLPLVFARAPTVAYGHFVVDVLDVGQAMAVVVRTRSRTLIYDTGAAWQNADAAQRVIVPYLRGLGLHSVQRVVVSHADLDHRGGARTLAATFSQAQWWSGEPERLTVPAQTCADASPWRWDGVVFSFVHPRTTFSWRGNNASCVLLVAGRHGRALLTGDLEALGEQSMLHADRVPAVDLVVGQHHGSATSSSADFVRATRARHVVFPTGYHNPWSFPRASVQQRWLAAGTGVHDTATRGGLQCVFDGRAGGPPMHGARQARPALWRSRAQL